MLWKGNEHMEELKEYLRTAQSDIDSITPVRFCENETVNLILSSFATKAKQANIQLAIDAKLPVSKEQGHGFGTKSMVHIVEKQVECFSFPSRTAGLYFRLPLNQDIN